MAMAIRASVTVSIADDDSGMDRPMRREERAEGCASEGMTSLLLGQRSTASNVKPVNAKGSLAAEVVTDLMVPAEQNPLSNDSPSISHCDGMGAVAGTQFAQNSGHMRLDCVIGKFELFADGAVR